MSTSIDHLLKGEKWKTIPGYVHYEISNLGRVRKISYLRINHHNDGYPQVQLFKSDGHGKRILGRGKQIGKKMLLHRLMAMAFKPNPKGHNQINHKDGNKTNFFLSNLEWCSHSQNMLHAYKLGLNKGGMSQQNRMVIQIDHKYRIVKFWKGVRELRDSGHTWNKVYASIRRGINYKGFKWLYIDFYHNYTNGKYFQKEKNGKVYTPLSEVKAKVAKRFTKRLYSCYKNQKQ